MDAKSITSAWLREYRPANGIIGLSPECAAILADALDEADESARCEIQTECPCVRRLSRFHYDVAHVDPMWRPRVEKARAYLLARGLIEECESSVVRILEKKGMSAP